LVLAVYHISPSSFPQSPFILFSPSPSPFSLTTSFSLNFHLVHPR
jgi:hypothetical protein